MTSIKNDINIVETLSTLRNQLYDLSYNNPLMNVTPSKLILNIEDNQFENGGLQYKKQNYYLNEFGLETSLFVGLFIKWQSPKTKKYYCSPLLYKPCRIIKKQKIQLKYLVEFEDDDWQTNVIIQNLFEDHFNLKLNSNYTSISELIFDLKSFFNTPEIQIQELNHFSEEENWLLIRKEAVGIFNYKKSTLSVDFKKIIEKPNKLIQQVLGYEDSKIEDHIVEDIDDYPLDSSQKNVLSFSNNNNLVIQGPPGTGKSHVIASMIQNFMKQGKKVLFVSEKKSALKVVYDKLENLNQLIAYFDPENNPKKSYYTSLRNTYHFLLQNPNSSKPDSKFYALLKNSKLYPVGFNHFESDINCNINDLQSDLIESSTDISGSDLIGQIPDLKSWNMYLEELLKIEELATDKIGLTCIGESHFLKLNPSIFHETSPFQKLDIKIKELTNIVKSIEVIQKKYNLNLSLDNFSKLCLSASILKMVNHQQMDILVEDTKLFKSFNSWIKKFDLFRLKLNKQTELNNLWNVKPSAIEIQKYLLIQDQSSLLSWFKKRQNHQKIFKEFNESVEFSQGKKIINNLIKENELKSNLDEIKIKLKHDLGIINPETEINFILDIRKKLNGLSHHNYQLILEKENALECINDLANVHEKISAFYRLKNYLFTNNFDFKISELEPFLSKLINESKDWYAYPAELKDLLSTPSKILYFLSLNSLNVSSINSGIIAFHLRKKLKYEPYLEQLSGDSLLKDIQNFNHVKKNRLVYSRENILCDKQKVWKEVEVLTTTPHVKLNEAEKKRKKEYKAVKRLLIHEMNKQQQHVPVKKFFEETKEILFKIQPVWMMNPLAISERLPNLEDIFDVVIFDESSQIPIEDAIPALYRSKKCIVVGDNKQMPPSKFFSASASSTSLLFEAEKFIKAVNLNWHYRSQHPQLISFSNINFYDNNLKTFIPNSNASPIKFHYDKRGVFENRINEIEAIAIVNRLNELLKNGITNIGIISFSKDQENCIRKTILDKGISLPEEVLIRNLENVQGIERDHILISIGYAKNQEGKLRLNFGPINHELGANRLNVLFSRAKYQMEIFTSITSKDIGLSDNYGVSMLAKFLDLAEGKNQIQNFESDDVLTNFIYNNSIKNKDSIKYYSSSDGNLISGFVCHKTKKVLLVNPCINDSIDINTVVNYMTNQFKSIKIILNNDWIKDSAKVLNEIDLFFK